MLNFCYDGGINIIKGRTDGVVPCIFSSGKNSEDCMKWAFLSVLKI